MAVITVDQILQACLAGAVGLLAAAIKWGASSLNTRLKALEVTVGEYAKQLLTLAMNEKSILKAISDLEHAMELKASKEILERVEERQEDIAKRLHHVANETTRVKLIQSRCKTCNS